MNLDQLQSFRAVAESGGFNRAADIRFLAQSTISVQIAALERELGTPLFERLGRRVVLTNAGQEFLRYAVRILALVEESRQIIEDIRGLVSGQLLVGASHTVGNYLVPRLFGRFNARYPGVRLVVEIAETPLTAQRVLEGLVDLGLVEWPVEIPKLLMRPFVKDQLVLVVPPTHPWAQQKEIDPQELAHERFIVREPKTIIRRFVDERLGELGIEIRPVLELGTPEAVREAICAGLGVGIVSRHVVRLALKAGALAEVPIRGLRLERDLYLILHRDKHLSSAISAFLSLLGPTVGDLPGLRKF